MRALTEIRAAITRARDTGNHEERTRLQAEYRSLPLEQRRELLTAERVDERSGRRVIFPATAPRTRAVSRATSVPAAADAQPTLYGHFAVFNVWSEIESFWEGNFMERLVSGSLKQTIKEDRAQMRITLNHGRDPQLGNKVLARIEELREDSVGAYYEAPLYAGIDQLVLAGLRDDAYGASMRFYVMAEEFVEKPKPSSYNPRGIPERSLTQIMVEEFGPVTFPQYPQATARVRSLVPQIKPAAAVAASTPLRSRDEWLRSISKN